MSSAFIKFGFMAICLSFSLSSTSSFAKEYYKWVDAKGSTHYTATPPPKSAQKKGKINTYGSHHTSTTTASNNQAHPAANEAAKEAEKAAQESKPIVTIPQIPASAMPHTLSIGDEVARPSNPSKYLLKDKDL